MALDGEPFDERVASLGGFYERLRGGALATTSLPSPGNFADAYERAAARGAEGIVSIHLDARTSGTVAAAELAARDAPLPVRVVDTRTASFGVALCVRAAADAVAAGGSLDEASEAATQLGSTLDNVFVARFGPGGRVPTTAAWTLLAFRDGATAAVGECASVDAAVEAMAGEMLRAGRAVSVAVGHAAGELEPAADALAEALAREDLVTSVERYRIGAAVGAHTGPDSFGGFWWPR